MEWKLIAIKTLIAGVLGTLPEVSHSLPYYLIAFVGNIAELLKRPNNLWWLKVAP